MMLEKPRSNQLSLNSNISCERAAEIPQVTPVIAPAAVPDEFEKISPLALKDNHDDKQVSPKAVFEFIHKMDKSQENPKSMNTSRIDREETEFVLVTPAGIPISNSKTNDTPIKSLHHSLLERNIERNLVKNSLETSKEEQYANLFSDMTPLFSLPQAPVISQEETSPSTTMNIKEENSNDDDIFSSLLPVMALAPKPILKNDKTSNFCNNFSEGTKTILEEENNTNSSLDQDDILVGESVSMDISDENNPQENHRQLPHMPEEKNLSIERQCIAINDLIAESLSEATALMGNMRQQLKENQRQLEELGVLPPKSALNTVPDVEDVCSNREHIFVPRRPSMTLFHNINIRRASGKETFPMKFHRLLLDLEHIDGGSSIAAFLPGGKSFVIKDIKKFEKTVLKMYFPRMKSFSSFHRQLNLYDFERQEQAKGTYSHPLFCRDQPELAVLMKATRGKKAATTSTSAATVFDSHCLRQEGKSGITFVVTPKKESPHFTHKGCFDSKTMN